jgi:hypothetical protein
MMYETGIFPELPTTPDVISVTQYEPEIIRPESRAVQKRYEGLLSHFRESVAQFSTLNDGEMQSPGIKSIEDQLAEKKEVGKKIADAQVLVILLYGGIGDSIHYMQAGVALALRFPQKKVYFLDPSRDQVKTSLLRKDSPQNIQIITRIDQVNVENANRQELPWKRLWQKTSALFKGLRGSEVQQQHLVAVINFNRFSDHSFIKQTDLPSKLQDTTQFVALAEGILPYLSGNRLPEFLPYILPYLLGNQSVSRRRMQFTQLMRQAYQSRVNRDREDEVAGEAQRQALGYMPAAAIDQALFVELLLMDLEITPELYTQASPVALPEKTHSFSYDACFFYHALAGDGVKSITSSMLEHAVREAISKNPHSKILVVRDPEESETAERLAVAFPENVTLAQGSLKDVFFEAAKAEKIVFPDTAAAHYFSWLVREWQKDTSAGVIPELYEVCGGAAGFDLNFYVPDEAHVLATPSWVVDIPPQVFADFVFAGEVKLM